MTKLCYIDCETTGLDPRIHQPYEVCYWLEDEDEPVTLWLPHSLENADPKALGIGKYFERGFTPNENTQDRDMLAGALVRDLAGVTLVGSNPAFDAGMLTRFIGTAVWHHRMIDVAAGAMWVFSWDRPKGLNDVVMELRSRGYAIMAPDHSAERDVRVTRQVHEALCAESLIKVGGTRG